MICIFQTFYLSTNYTLLHDCQKENTCHQKSQSCPDQTLCISRWQRSSAVNSLPDQSKNYYATLFFNQKRIGTNHINHKISNYLLDANVQICLVCYCLLFQCDMDMVTQKYPTAFQSFICISKCADKTKIVFIVTCLRLSAHC